MKEEKKKFKDKQFWKKHTYTKKNSKRLIYFEKVRIRFNFFGIKNLSF